MNPASLSWLLDHTLPLNRKERFYTGTVLPGLVCADFGELHRLTTLMGHPDVIDASGDPANPGVLFFTEYGIAESVYGPSAERFTGMSTARDTPDVVFLTTQPTPALFALEAKMYDRPGGGALRQQLELQRQLLDPLAKRLATMLQIPQVPVIHRALLPNRLARELTLDPHQVITWEQIRETYVDVAPTYWVQMLTEALDRYEELVSQARPNDDERMSGEDIINAHQAGTLAYAAVGRAQGLNGPQLEADIQTGTWRSRLYQVATKHPNNPNWFSVEDFVTRVTRAIRSRGSLDDAVHQPRDRQAATVALRTDLEHATMMGTRVFGDESVLESIANAPDGAFADFSVEELNRVARLYRGAAEAARHARAEASDLFSHVSAHERGTD